MSDNFALDEHKYKKNIFYNADEMHDNLNYYWQIDNDDFSIISFDESAGVVSIALCESKYENKESWLKIIDWISIYAVSEENGEVSEQRISRICENLAIKKMASYFR